MLAQSDPAAQEAIATVYKLSQDEKIRLQCEAREEYYRIMRGKDEAIQELTDDKEQLILEKAQLISENQRLRQLLIEHGISAEPGGTLHLPEAALLQYHDG